MDTMNTLSVINRLEHTRKSPNVSLKSKNLNTANKIKAKELFDKESLNSKKSRLECLLAQQFIAKYGSKQPNSQLNQIIKSIIHEAIMRTNDVENQRFLVTLERDVAEKAEEHKSMIQTARTESLQRSVSAGNEIRDVKANSLNASSSHNTLNPNQWSVLNAIQSVAAEEEARKVRQVSELKKMKFRDELDQQLSLVEQRKQQEREEKNRLRYEAEKVCEQVERDKEIQKRTLLQKHQTDREIIKCQIEERKIMKEIEREESIRRDQIEMRRAQARAQEEDEFKLLKKMKEKEQQEALRIENEKVKEKKRVDLLLQYQEEKKLEEEYRKKLDRDDQMRNEAFNKRLEIMNKNSEKYAKEGAGAQAIERKRIEDERLRGEIEKKNLEEELKRKRKDDLIKSRMKETSEENMKIIQEKEKEKEKKQIENRELRDRYQREYEESREEERRKNENRRTNAMEMKVKLDQQIQEKHVREDGELGGAGIKGIRGIRNSLSQREIELNKSLLKKMEEDGAFQEEVYRRLNPNQNATRGRPTGGSIFP